MAEQDKDRASSTPESGTGDGWAQTPQGEAGTREDENESADTTPAAAAPDPGDPGGMGGVRAGSATPHHRPPGGVSPVDGKEGGKHES